MNCPACADRGFRRIRYRDGTPDEFGICLCEIGRQMRATRNGGRDVGVALWEAWAAREGVDPARVAPLEDLLEPDELRQAFGGSAPAAPPRPRASTLADAARTTKGPRL